MKNNDNDNFSESIILKTDFCSIIAENISAFIDCELHKDIMIKIFDHILECEHCQNTYKNLRITQKSLHYYFNNSTEKFNIIDESYRQNIISRVIFAQRQRKIIYSAVAIGILAGITYFSTNIANISSPEKDAVHKVKLTKKRPLLLPVPALNNKNSQKEPKNKIFEKE